MYRQAYFKISVENENCKLMEIHVGKFYLLNHTKKKRNEEAEPFQLSDFCVLYTKPCAAGEV